MGKPKLKYYGCGLVVLIAGLGLPSSYVRELLVSFVLFTVVFLFLALIALGVLLAWWAGEQVALRTKPLSRSVVAFSHRLIATYASSWTLK